MSPGDFTVTGGFRHVYSHVHFSGPTENFSREQLGTQVQSKTNIETVTVTYQLTPRWSLTGTLPFLSASRRNQSQYGTLHTSGIGDVSAGFGYWVRHPKSERSGFNNAQIGLSLLMPTGNDHQTNLIATSYGATPTTQYPDYSVQPGGGTWGMIMSGQVFQSLGSSTVLFVDGTYTMTQGGHHDFWTSHGGTTNSAPAATKGLTQFDAVQDQYMIEVGATHPAPRIRGLAMTLAVREEGVPAKNLMGDDLGFRRPGFGVSLTPGFIYTRGNNMLQFSVGKVLIRDRTKSVAEQVNGAHEGDAAFANYVWMAAYTLKMPGKRGSVDSPNLISSVRKPSTAAAAKALAEITNPPAPTDVKTPETFKPFVLKTLDGKRKTLKDFANKATLVNFFYPRCPYCNVELPEVQKLFDQYKDKGLSVVWINILPEEVNLIAGWAMVKNFNVPVLIGGTQDALAKDYRINSTPTSYLLDENGKVLYFENGYQKGDEKILEAKIASALKIAPLGATGSTAGTR